jgi:hypothetical protein
MTDGKVERLASVAFVVNAQGCIRQVYIQEEIGII